MEITLLLAIWGSVLSTALAGFKIFEYWNNRFKIEVSPLFRGAPELGHDISIKNLSPKPVLLEHMELYRKKGDEIVNLWSPEDSFINARIEPYGNKVFNFSEGDYFGWNAGEVYVRLWFAGKKEITRKITNDA